jgi:maleamate amidohydrolase
METMDASPPERDSVLAAHAGTWDDYQRRGFGRRVGFGQRPMLVVVDMCSAFLDPAYGLGSSQPGVVAGVRRAVRAFHSAGAPVAYVVTEYAASMADTAGWHRKIPALEELVEGTPAVALVEGLPVTPADTVVVKKASSGFFGTSLAAFGIRTGIDTVFVTGVSTSACVRATAVDSCSYGWHTGVVTDAVGDRSPEQHAANLFDLEAKYADLLTVAELERYLMSVYDAA